jgi:hypothetical protein
MSLNGRDIIEVAYSANSLRSNILENMQQPSQFETGSGSYNDPNHITANKETVVHEDWICEYVTLFGVLNYIV